MRGLKRKFLRALIKYGPLSLIRPACGALVPILRYHSLECSGACVSTPPDVWLGHLDYLQQNGYHVISLEQYSTASPPKTEETVIMTFDDGYENNFEHAFNELSRRGFSGTFFVVPHHVNGHARWLVRDLQDALVEGHKSLDADLDTFCAKARLNEAYLTQRLPELIRLGRRACLRELYLLNKMTTLPLMSWDQLRAMRRAGMEIGAHTLTHANLELLSPEKAREEIHGAKHAIEDEIGEEVRSFCYPYGAVGADSARCVREAGFVNACTCTNGYYRTGDSPYLMRRIGMEKMTDVADVDFYINPRYRRLISRLCRARERR